MRKKKNSQNIGTSPIECPIANEAEPILSESSLNAPEKEADSRVTVTDNEAEHQAAAKDNEADGPAITTEDEVVNDTANPNTEKQDCPPPPETETETKTEIETETQTKTEIETDHQADKPDSTAISHSGNIERLMACHLPDEREKAELASLLKNVFEEYGKGAFSEHTVRYLCHAINYERAIQDAFRQGEIKGRNYRIEEYLIEHRNAEEVRQLGSSSAPSRPTPPASVIGGLSAADRKTIWERGHERRVRHH